MFHAKLSSSLLKGEAMPARSSVRGAARKLEAKLTSLFQLDKKTLTDRQPGQELSKPIPVAN